MNPTSIRLATTAATISMIAGACAPVAPINREDYDNYLHSRAKQFAYSTLWALTDYAAEVDDYDFMFWRASSLGRSAEEIIQIEWSSPADIRIRRFVAAGDRSL